jgi:hypothetical protein
MTTNTRIILTTVIAGLSGALAFAGKATDLKPVLAQSGKLVVEEDFSGGALPTTWTTPKGDWKPQDGAVVGKEKTEDHHAAVLTLGQKNHNSIIRFSFRLDGAEGFALSFNHATGHLFRISVSTAGMRINKDADKKDPSSKSLPLGKADGKFEKGQWHTMLVEVQGSKVAVQTDNEIKVDATHPELDVDKTGYRFVLSGESLVLDDVRVWEAQP